MLRESSRRLVVEENELSVTADSLRLEQAPGNMLDNTLCHAGGAIRLSARRQNGHVELHVGDDGPL